MLTIDKYQEKDRARGDRHGGQRFILEDDLDI